MRRSSPARSGSARASRPGRPTPRSSSTGAPRRTRSSRTAIPGSSTSRPAKVDPANPVTQPVLVLAGDDRYPTFAPDGAQIAFRHGDDLIEPSGDEEVYVMDADGTNVRRLTDSPGLDEGPVWSPDGTKIAFSSDRDGQQEIYVMNADGSDPRRLTDNPALHERRSHLRPRRRAVQRARALPAGRGLRVARPGEVCGRTQGVARRARGRRASRRARRHGAGRRRVRRRPRGVARAARGAWSGRPRPARTHQVSSSTCRARPGSGRGCPW
jgi:dipeptidyl aminopeptidase/acylaminoacyl peptidase